jgi:tRNA dimethylallyltransferase
MPLAGKELAARPLVVILGPTAVGKTAIAIQVAQALDGEIISADSRQVYRYMNIGTAKPTPEQRAAVPHHLLDVVNPDEAFNAVDFQRLAAEAVEAIHVRGRLPLVVGGTGQYITALIDGWQFPHVPANPALRAELEAIAETQGWEALFERLRQLDPLSAERIEGRNVRRVVRALEVCLETGRPFSEFQTRRPPPYAIRQFGLTLAERAALYQRADARIDQMLAAGLVDEVRALAEAGYTWSLSAMSGLGYLEIGRVLRGEWTLDEAVIELRRQTRSFIRRQYTWFRKHDAEATWVESDAQAAATLIEQSKQWLAALPGQTA